MNQPELWATVTAIKHRVVDTIGLTLPHAFRSTQAYQAYAGICGEAQMAYADGELTEEIIRLLNGQADKVMALWQKDFAQAP